MAHMNRNQLCIEITNQFVNALHSGAPPWIRPWNSPKAINILPSNAITGRRYSGVNITILWSAAATRGYTNDRWLTYAQAQQVGATVEKGEQATTVVFYRTLQVMEKDEDGTPELDEKGQPKFRTVKLMKGIPLFNIEQCASVPRRILAQESQTPEKPEWQINQEVEDFVKKTGAMIRHDGVTALYIPKEDYILMPPKTAFESNAGYYSTILHELAHWTGNKSRLAREGIVKNCIHCSEKYGYEELIAEIGSAYLCALFGIHGEMRHEGYVISWIRMMENDPNVIFKASAQAWQATEYLMALCEEQKDPDQHEKE